MEFRVLGPLEVVGYDGTALPLGGTRQRAILAALLLDAGRPISAHRLTELVWESPPASAAHAVEVYVSRWRKLLAAAEPGHRPQRITRSGGGYAVLVDPDEHDLLRFRKLAGRGATDAACGNHAAAVDAFAEALELWRGEPLACIDGTPLAQLAHRELEEERLAAAEEHVDAVLALGRHGEAIPRLRQLVAAHPHREQLWGKLMLALYRAGRQAEALDAYMCARRDLLEQFGVEPCRELRELHRRILDHSAELDLRSRADAAQRDGKPRAADPARLS